MVYCGKPSKGCDYCRKKRLKCDQKKPGCGQCRNACRTCPGYRNQLDLLFRDESSRVQQRYHVPASGKSSDDDQDAEGERGSDFGESTGRSSRSSPEAVAVSKPLSKGVITGAAAGPAQMPPNTDTRIYVGGLYPAMSQTLSEIATGFFLTHYTPGSHFDYLPLLYGRTKPDSLLINVVQAVALASLSNETRKPELMSLARQQYSRSLIDTNSALRDAVACRKDDTLGSVLLLAHFETLASEDRTGVSNSALIKGDQKYSPSASWERHMQGAVSLLLVRNKPQLADPVSIRLASHVIANARYSSIQRRERLPAELASWGRQLGMVRDMADPNRRFMTIVYDFTELRACMREGSLTDPLEIIRHASAIDDAAAAVARSFPPKSSYDVVTSAREIEGIYKNKYHLYPSHVAAQLWNDLRMSRLALNEMICDQVERAQLLSPPINDDDDIFLSALHTRCARTINKMATEICQSSTSFLQRPNRDPYSATPVITGSPSMASAYFLIWPMFIAAGSAKRGSPPELAEFVVRRLRFMNVEMNIPQAGKAADLIEQGLMDEDWLHMLHLF